MEFETRQSSKLYAEITQYLIPFILIQRDTFNSRGRDYKSINYTTETLIMSTGAEKKKVMGKVGH